MSGYIGTQPVPQATQTRDSFTATSNQTSFATSGYTPNFLDVFLNGVKLSAADYTASNGSDVVLATGAATGDILEVVAYTNFDTANVTGAANFTVTGSFTSQGIDDNANATAITIDSSENVLVGASAVGMGTSSSVTGAAIRGSIGYLEIARDGDSAARLNRQSSDGSIIDFAKDGSTVGSIGAKSDDAYIGTGDTGVRFNDGNDQIWPVGASGASRDAAIDLGNSGVRFKDLYLSGGVYLGGTGAANKLDDVETGTFVVDLTWSTPGNSSVSYLARTGQYVKVGRMVTFQLQNRLNIVTKGTASGNVTITGFPFAFLNTGGYGSSGLIPFCTNLPITSGHTLICAGDSNTTNARFYTMQSNGAFVNSQDPNAYGTINISGTYMTI